MKPKVSFYDAQSKGFTSQPQMRYLLMLAQKHPEEYSWVYQVLRDHGVPERSTALNTHWTDPYEVSPKTPSYKYRKSMLVAIIKFAQKLDDFGFLDMADKLDGASLRKIDVDYQAAREVANTFWTIRGGEFDRSNKEGALSIENLLELFRPYQNLPNSETKAEASSLVHDKMLGRDK